MAPTLYMIHASPPVRAVLMTAKALGLKLDEKEMDLFQGEHLKPEYNKLNPQHTVPTLVDDDGFTIWDSHAVMAYLVSKYGKDDALYPKDLKKRAVVDQRLHFDSGVVFFALISTTKPIYGGKTTVDQSSKDAANEGYAFLEVFLEGKEWVAGDFVSIADYSLIASVTSFNILVPVDPAKFPKVTAWIKKCQGLPEYEANKKGLGELSSLLRSKLTDI